MFLGSHSWMPGRLSQGIQSSAGCSGVGSSIARRTAHPGLYGLDSCCCTESSPPWFMCWHLNMRECGCSRIPLGALCSTRHRTAVSWAPRCWAASCSGLDSLVNLGTPEAWILSNGGVSLETSLKRLYSCCAAVSHRHVLVILPMSNQVCRQSLRV